MCAPARVDLFWKNVAFVLSLLRLLLFLALVFLLEFLLDFFGHQGLGIHGQELCRCSLCAQAAFLYPEQGVAAFHRAQPVGNDDDGEMALQVLYGFHDGLFRAEIQGAGGFVQNEHVGVGVEGSGYGNALGLTAGQAGGIVANGVVYAALVRVNEIQSCHVAGTDDPLPVAGLAPGAAGHVFGYGAVEDVGGLGHIAHPLDIGCLALLGEAHVVHPHLAPAHGQKPAQNADQGGLARARGANDAYLLPLGNAQVHALEAVMIGARISEADIVQGDLPVKAKVGVRQGGIGQVLLLYALQAIQAGHGHGPDGAQKDEAAKRAVENGQDTPGHQHDQGDHRRDGHHVGVLEFDEHPDDRGNGQKAEELKYPGGDGRRYHQEGMGPFAGLQGLGVFFKEGFLLTVEDDFPDAAHGRHGGAVFRSLALGRRLAAAIDIGLHGPVGHKDNEAGNAKAGENGARRGRENGDKQGYGGDAVGIGIEDVDHKGAQLPLPAQGLEHGAAVPGHVVHVAALQEVRHDGGAGIGANLLAKPGAAPVGQGREPVLAGNEQHHQPAGQKREVAGIGTDLAQGGKMGKDALREGMREDSFRHGYGHGHEGHGKDGKDFRYGQKEHERKKTSYLPACPCRQYLQKAAQIANEEFSLYIHEECADLF